ncbi:hypothetical protein [Sphingomonas sp. VDB2]|uniref:hypothetical protein n=1 Tax=Sphingomonas sp. VDB2 TaxID=3228751 RepID=UPI003A80BCD2
MVEAVAGAIEAGSDEMTPIIVATPVGLASLCLKDASSPGEVRRIKTLPKARRRCYSRLIGTNKEQTTLASRH